MISEAGITGITRKMVVQVLFSQREVLDGPRKLTAAKLDKLVDPDPSHCVEHQPDRQEEKRRNRPGCPVADRSQGESPPTLASLDSVHPSR